MTGPDLVGKKRRPADLETVRLFNGPGNNSTSIRNGVTHELKAGDVIVIPAGTGHWFTKIDDHITYLMVRIDPDKVRRCATRRCRRRISRNRTSSEQRRAEGSGPRGKSTEREASAEHWRTHDEKYSGSVARLSSASLSSVSARGSPIGRPKPRSRRRRASKSIRCGPSRCPTNGFWARRSASPWMRRITSGSFIAPARSNPAKCTPRRIRRPRSAARPRRRFSSSIRPATSSATGAARERAMTGRTPTTASPSTTAATSGSAATAAARQRPVAAEDPRRQLPGRTVSRTRVRVRRPRRSTTTWC